MSTKKFLQGERRMTILGELYNKVVGREIERTFKLTTDINSSHIARVIYDKLKETSAKNLFSLIQVGIIRSIIEQKQYELGKHEYPFNIKITVNSYEKEHKIVKIKSPPVRKYKKVKVKEEIKFIISSSDSRKSEEIIQEVFSENFAKPLKEGNSWKKEKYQIFIEIDKNIFTIAVSQMYMLQDHDDLIDVQSTAPLIRVEVEYQGTQSSDLSENVQAEERQKAGKQELIGLDFKVEKEIIEQIRKISQRVLEICEDELGLPPTAL